jgi:hypothetical protein
MIDERAAKTDELFKGPEIPEAAERKWKNAPAASGYFLCKQAGYLSVII